METRERYGPKVWLLVLALGVLYLVAAATEVPAQPIEPLDVDLPITTVIRGAPGSVHLVGTIDAEAGQSCVAELSEFRNQDSFNANNDILVGPVTFANVESGTFDPDPLSFTATGPIPVAVRLGADRVFSAGFLLEVTCNPPTTTTTATEPPPSTTSTVVPPTVTTTPPVTTTTLSPPPEGGVPAGGGSEADTYNWWPAVALGGVALLFAGALVAAALGVAGVGDRKDRHE